LFGFDYGAEDTRGLSPTEREFDRATEKGKHRLIFVKGTDGKGRHPKMAALIRKAGSQLIRRRFLGIPDLTAAVYASLVEYLEQTGGVQIEEAFSVEAVTKEFFGRYADLFGDINAALEKLITKDKALRDEFKAKGVNAVDFAKKLMGQIVFLYFLQKKGWMGVEKGKDWGTGPRAFLRKVAQTFLSAHPDGNLFNDVFEGLPRDMCSWEWPSFTCAEGTT